MFAEGYFSLSFAEVIGFLVTIVSVYYLGRQLREAKLASQFEGMISLSQISADVYQQSQSLVDLIRSEEWKALTDDDAHALIQSNKDYQEGWHALSSFNELVGNMVKSGALDMRIAYEDQGYFLPASWRGLEKYARARRKELSVDALFDNWEWLAKEFEKMNR